MRKQRRGTVSAADSTPAPAPPSAPLPRWLAGAVVPCAPDFAERVVHRPAERAERTEAGVEAGGEDGVEADRAAGLWRRSPTPGLEVRTFECLRRGGAARFAGQVRSAPDAPPAALDAAGAELLVQRGAVGIDAHEHGAGSYLRLPPGTEGATSLRLLPGTLVYLSIGQMAPTDDERRTIDTAAGDRWLEGPVAGVEVLPLHGHRTGNAMLVRWLGPAAFRPRLDPTGEELLVLEGTLHDALGTYPADTWIRNPVPAWQSWAGTAGTLVCYKSGHFGELP